MDMQVSLENRVRLVMWELTRACRLSCLHCSAGARQRRSQIELSTYEAYKAIDQMAMLHPEELILTGGDPLERPDLYQLIDYAVRRGLEPALTVSPTPELTGAAMGNLRRHGLGRVVIGIESSSPDRHDGARGLAGQFASTLLAIRWARMVDLEVEVNTLVGRRTADDLESTAQFLAELGVSRWNVYFLVPASESKDAHLLTARDVEDVFERLQQIGARAPFVVRAFEAPHYRRFLLQKGLEARRRSLERYFQSADAEDLVLEKSAMAAAITDRGETIFVSHTGEVSMSRFLPVTAGNIRYQALAAIYRSSDGFVALRNLRNLKGTCGRCEFRAMCGGSRARAFAAGGDMFATDPLCSYEPGQFGATAPMLAPGA
ncbi:MAG TPA: radical SAM protein [Thermoanaerobaculia bacterium]|nr:radical SAM protein [Thermoanaerobaculia bacterium]